jgi:hypothetical protein
MTTLPPMIEAAMAARIEQLEQRLVTMAFPTSITFRRRSSHILWGR